MPSNSEACSLTYLKIISILAMNNYTHVDSSSHASDISFPWLFTWLNTPTIKNLKPVLSPHLVPQYKIKENSRSHIEISYGLTHFQVNYIKITNLMFLTHSKVKRCLVPWGLCCCTNHIMFLPNSWPNYSLAENMWSLAMSRRFRVLMTC